ncbi:adenylate/guanylate cyclase domain-containing protein [Ramlibacter pallidus]|uniref:Adenylate/guanylate cyclase domain-containing protein n=1 Tax=Ramlibacter pallidus TaxID=2780087 RepID=A0ABR9S098_9BURK|nr:adenylate/guanylate cyclase domain-containing protein [Ramlibacter pallidus]MBE7366942.1 adenylate/guanylate cyclase domain-containing protein [Ramlibacter pallidus]
MSLTGLDASRFTRATKIIAVADVVESVRLMERAEREFIMRWQRFVDFAETLVARESGRVHKSLGDGLMLQFSHPEGFVRAALAMQAWFDESNAELPPSQQAHLRVGAHLADYVADKHDIYGTDVNLAARIASLAGPGEIVISAALRQRLGPAPALSVSVQDLGGCHVKHVKQPIHAFRVGHAGRAPVIPAQTLDTHALRATVAVLPLATGGELSDALGADTLADELVAVLTRSDALQVISRISAAPPGLAQSGARYVLTGRARLHGSALRLYVEVADTQNGHVIWAHTFEGEHVRHGTVDARLLAGVELAVHAAVIHHEVELSRGRPLPALQEPTLLLAALGLMHRLSPVDMDHSRGMLEHLTDRWRRHAMAHAWLAHLHVLRVQQAGAGVRGHDQALARAHGAAGVRCDPESALVLALDGHASLHGARNLQCAADRYAQALSLRGDHSLALLFRAELQAMQGCPRTARALAARAAASLALEPLRYMYDAIAALAALADHDAVEAARLAQQSLDRNPRYLPAWHTLIVAQVESERLGEARGSQQQLLKRQPAFGVRSFLEATALGDELARRFADALLSAGTPR